MAKPEQLFVTPAFLVAVLLTVGLALSACGGGQTSPIPETEPTLTRQADGTLQGETPVACGCSIPGIGTCGNYIEVEGEMRPLVLPEGMDLGAMPFCGKEGLVAEVEGKLAEGTFRASAFRLLDAQGFTEDPSDRAPDAANPDAH